MLTGSPNFTLSEVVRASKSLTLAELQSEPYPENVARLLAMMEGIRATLGHRRITLTSIGRDEAFNDSLPGASATSAHLTALAADFTVEGLTAVEAFNALRPSVRALKIDQLILYDDGHLHASADPRARGQVIDKRAKQSTATAPLADANASASDRTGTPISTGGGCAGVVLFLALVPASLFLAL
jgi:hypothetical protein